ncbi:DUF736 domain-containing protein [Novosphingobium sp. JCM 18896]|uniref:DUF736 domain-containing protein n=1 Tax=Novosphingobium sp. JCM 18896 TaxID=2989731 RepID=UPI0022232A0B|nr:DUF736 domain-containing protein [Novosphingobium sp. JCM 18896]MCW1432001.1 DUF736 domain-containing protein [Novosphingobium sp. JCM 18896]
MSMNIGNLKANEQGTPVGRIVTLGFNAVVALRGVVSNNERAPVFDVMGLSADRRTWVKIGALWEYSASGTGESFYSGRLDDPSLAAPLDIAVFKQEDESFNVSWRRPQRKREMPAASGDGALPPMPPAEPEGDQVVDPAAGGDGLGDSTAPAPKTPARGKQKEFEPA